MSGRNENLPLVLFMGLGVMGGPMAANLLASGRYRMKVHDIDPEKTALLVQQGADVVTDLGQVIGAADIVMTSLPGPVQVEEVAFGKNGLFDCMRSGTDWIDLSTNNLTVCARVVEAASRNGVHFLDAPVSGGDEGARAGTLSILVGGDRKRFEQNRTVFGVIGKDINYLGPNGAGYSAKIAQVVLCYVHSLALSEALMLGVKGGVNVSKMLDIVRTSTGRSYVADRYGPCILEGDYDPSFTIGLALKDMKLAMELAEDCGIKLPLCELTTRTYREALDAFGFDANHLKAVRLLEEENDAFLQVKNETESST